MAQIDCVKEILGKDLNFIETHLSDDPTGFWSRTLIKTLVSFVEAEIFSLKRSILMQCKLNSIALDPQVEIYLKNMRFELGGDGRLKEKLLQHRIRDDIKGVFSLLKNLRGFEQAVDYKHQGWQKLVRTVDVRNRLTHPKDKNDLNVSPREIEECINAFSWFTENIIGFSDQYAQELRDKTINVRGNVDS